MDAREKLKTNIVTQRYSESVVGKRSEEFADDLEKFMEAMELKYDIDKGRVAKLVIEYIL